MTLPDDMQALVVTQDGQTSTQGGLAVDDLAQLLALRRIPVPSPGPGQVLVKVAMSPVNPSDLLFVQGRYGLPRVPGAVAGFEGTGIVVAGGDAATSALVGQRVSFLAGASGAWAEYALTDAASCAASADELRDEDGAALLVNPLTAIAMIELTAAAGARALVLTAAASELGRMLIGLARERGMAAIAVLRRPAEAGALRALGAAEVLVSGAPEFRERLESALRAHKPRMLLDAVGDQVSADIFLAMPAHSTWISYGVLAERGPCLADMRQFVFANKRIEGFWLSRWLRAVGPETRAHAVAQVQQRFLSGTWRTRIAARIALEDALASLPAALGLRGKVLLAPGQQPRPAP
ncbi:MAG: alcohol dehydrogenase catalytic domain-containing protein [Burkholderiaceae bacterium]